MRCSTTSRSHASGPAGRYGGSDPTTLTGFRPRHVQVAAADAALAISAGTNNARTPPSSTVGQTQQPILELVDRVPAAVDRALVA